MGSKKLARMGISEPNKLVRSHKRGWVFAHNDLAVEGIDINVIKGLGISATRALGLDLAGVDILAKVVNGNLVHCLVCEVNSAPGMRSPTTFRRITDKVQEIIDGNK